jgi:hypothetical protein
MLPLTLAFNCILAEALGHGEFRATLIRRTYSLDAIKQSY